MIYFSKQQVNPEELDLIQYQKLRDFKKVCYGQGLMGEFKSPEELQQNVSQLLNTLGHELKKAEIQIVEDAEEKGLWEFEWIPSKPFVSESVSIKKIDEYPTDFHFDLEGSRDIEFEDGDIKIVKGFDCFKQQLVRLLNTEKDKYVIYEGTTYGLTYMFKSAENRLEFERMCQINIRDIMEQFDGWIREVHYIKKYADKQYIQIGLGLKGINEIVKIDAILL
ncbi:hypothetical protein HP398_00650 [Brevibacillus sp. HB1.4B]|uniref:hypothetical protein n=1 Tax=Brevibacillus sp. HB1.4B TaxID=2738845 RepID=UPI00156B6670|nr:hypothetical protein [Brevibacillus sp. HB1.4B]NRS14941.1 hypothetical protein [Brevibacillus sp. HB1.4B]